MADIAAEAYFPIALPECIPLEIATIRMIRDDLLSHGIATDDEIEQHLENVRSGALDLSQPPMISVRGRKPRNHGRQQTGNVAQPTFPPDAPAAASRRQGRG